MHCVVEKSPLVSGVFLVNRSPFGFLYLQLEPCRCSLVSHLILLVARRKIHLCIVFSDVYRPVYVYRLIQSVNAFRDNAALRVLHRVVKIPCQNIVHSLARCRKPRLLVYRRIEAVLVHRRDDLTVHLHRDRLAVYRVRIFLRVRTGKISRLVCHIKVVFLRNARNIRCNSPYSVSVIFVKTAYAELFLCVLCSKQSRICGL